MGADTILDVRSNWKNRPNFRAGYYECALGGWMVGVALKATAVIRERPEAVAAANPSLQAMREGRPTALVSTREQGKTRYQLLLGNPQVSAKFVAAPQENREQVSLALTFALDPANPKAPAHQSCTVVATAGGEQSELKDVAYERGADRETLTTTIPVAQLRKLVDSESALSACDTKVNLREESKRDIRNLISAIDGTSARRDGQTAPLSPTGELSL